MLEASDGQQGVALAEQHVAPIHLVISDVIMPNLSGPELARRVGVSHPESKIVYMSGYAADRITEPGLLPQEDAILLRKPFSPEALATKVRLALD